MDGRRELDVCHVFHLDNGLRKESLLKSYRVVSSTNKLFSGVQYDLSLLLWLSHHANVDQRCVQCAGVQKALGGV